MLELVEGTARESRHAVWCEKTWAPIIPALHEWKQQRDDIDVSVAQRQRLELGAESSRVRTSHCYVVQFAWNAY